MDPPNELEASQISQFLQHQATLQHRHPEKDSFTRWKLIENDARPGFATVMTVGSGRRIVSACTVTPKRLWRNGSHQLWGEIGDTFTDAGYLRKGMFAALVNATRTRAQQAGVSLIYGLPNDQSLPGYLSKLDFTIKHNLVLERYALFLGIRALLARPEFESVALLRSVLASAPLTYLSRHASRLALSLRNVMGQALDTTISTRFGAEFDELWERVTPSLSSAQVRDSRYLQWRYARNPFPFDVLVVSRGRQCLGYVATLTLAPTERRPVTHTIIVDWLYDPSVPGVARALLAAAVRHAIARGADMASAMTSSETPLALPFRASGFIRRRVAAQPVIFHQNESGRVAVADDTPWHFTWSDTDAF